MNSHQGPDRLPLLITVLLLVLLAFFVRHNLSPITPLDASAPNDVFSAERAFDAIKDLTREQVPHPVDSQANLIVADRLIQQLRAMGYQEEIQETETCRDSSRGLVRCTKVRNIIVHIAGDNQSDGILLSAHYDSVPASAGGSDAGAAVGALLEVARLLSTHQRPKNSIVLLFNEGEEFGLFGAHAFMEQHPLADKLKLAINIEARGSTGQSVMFETGEDSGWLVEHYAQTTPAPLTSSLFYEVYKFLPNDTDLTIFKSHGLQGLNFAHAEQEPHYHTTLDNLATLNKGSLQHHGDNVWGVLRQIKDQDLSEVKQGNLVYTDILGLFVIQWDETSSLWISLSLLLLTLLVCSLVRKTVSIKAIFIALVGLVVMLFIGAGVAWLVLKTTLLIGDSSEPWRANNLPMQIALWSGIAAVGLLFAKWLARSSSRINLQIGITASWLILAIACSVWLPGISFLFIVPSSIVIVVLFIQILFSEAIIKRFGQSVYSLLSIVTPLAAAIVFMPVVYTLEIMVSYPMSVALGVIFSFIISSMIPLFGYDDSEITSSERTSESSRQAKFWPLNLTLGITSLLAIGWTGLQAPFTEWTPQPLNMLYWQDENNEASLLLESWYKLQPKELLSALKKLEKKGASNNDTKLETLKRSAAMPWVKRQYPQQKLDSQSIPAADVFSIESESTSDGKKVSFELKAGIAQISDVILYIPTSAGLDSIEKGEKIFQYKDEDNRFNGYYQFHCRGQSCSNQTLNFNLSKPDKFELLVVQISKGLPQVFEEIANSRGAEAVERQNGDQSMVVTRIEL
jgi:hypothetical protein